MLITTPPVVKLTPVLRLDGVEVARGSRELADEMGYRQTWQLTFTHAHASGASRSVSNLLTVGDTIAVGLDYGRTSPETMAASQARLAASRATLPTNASGDPDLQTPENMAEPIIGATLHLAAQAYFNQLDAFAELIARGRQVRWFRQLSGGIAAQPVVILYAFGIPVETLGGSLGLDMPYNSPVAVSLHSDPDDERVFRQTFGYAGSVIEQTVWQAIGARAVSAVGLFELALAQGIPVYRIDATNKALIDNLVIFGSDIDYITQAVNAGLIVTVPQQLLIVGEWSGIGYVVLDPASGAASFFISGGLAANRSLAAGGSLIDILRDRRFRVADHQRGWRCMGDHSRFGPDSLPASVGFAGRPAHPGSAAFALLQRRKPVPGHGRFQQLAQRRQVGLPVSWGAGDGHVYGEHSAAAGSDRRSPGHPAPGRARINQRLRQLTELTAGASDRLRGQGFSAAEVVYLSTVTTNPSDWSAIADFGVQYGVEMARALVANDFVAAKSALGKVAGWLWMHQPLPGGKRWSARL